MRTLRLRSRLPFLLGMLAVLHAAAQPAAAQKTVLRWKYAEGSELLYRTTNRQDVDLSAMGASIASEQIQTQRWRVTAVAPNGDATIVVSTERVQFDMQGPTGPVKYDSESGEPPADPQARAIAAMAGIDLTMVIAADGTVRSVAGLDQLREKMLASLPPEQVAMMQSVAGEMFSEASITRMMQQSVQMFPTGAIGRGDTWNSSFSMEVPFAGAMTTNMTFTLAGLEPREGRNVATIDVSGQMLLDGSSANPLPMTFELGDTKMTGTIEFDVDRGITLASTVSTAMQMTVSAGGQQFVMGMTNALNLALIEYRAGR